MNQNPEQLARNVIDKVLTASRWIIQFKRNFNLAAGTGVWQVLGAVKKEFNQFGTLLEKAPNNIQISHNQLGNVVGKRTRAIQRKLKGVEVLNEKIITVNGVTATVLLDEEE